MRQYVLVVLLMVWPGSLLDAAVVINEIFYSAPDDHEEVQWIELHNTADQPADLGGWTLDEGKTYTFPPNTRVDPKGYVVVARNVPQFQRFYPGIAALGPMSRPLRRGGEKITLSDAERRVVDVARYRDRAPWPVSADGLSCSLERVFPGAPGEGPENWVASPLPAGEPSPGGTPGKQNAAHQAELPPVIRLVAGLPQTPAAEQPLEVLAELEPRPAAAEVVLLYRVVTAGQEGAEYAVRMAREGDAPRYRAAIPGQPGNTIIRYRVRATTGSGAVRHYPDPNDVRCTLSTLVAGKWELGAFPLGAVIHVRSATPATMPSVRRATGIFAGLFGGRRARGGAPVEPRLARGASAFVHVDPETRQATLFDYVNVIPRDRERGWKVFFNKDQPLDGISALSVIYEGNERFLLAERMAYDVYRRAGCAAPRADFMRLMVDGRLVGYYLAVERPNKSFLRRNKINDEGNLYKLIWYGRDVVGQHEKKTHAQSGHDDLLEIIQRLRATQGDEQWKLIQEKFNVEQVATYFAVNMVLSHWDGYFNNYYAYHDTNGTGKWEMYPWDQDKTWGYYDGLPPDQVFFNMPLTFGMNGDRPPGGAGGMFGGGFGAMWWRPPGYFSGPLLANPQFRKVFLARTRFILEKVYTQENYFPLLDATAQQLRGEVQAWSKAFGRDPNYGLALLEENVKSLKQHLVKRREFLLAQPELTQLAP